MKKDFSRDAEGKITNCYSNVAKMSILEYIRFDVVDQGFFQYGFMDLMYQWWEFLKLLAMVVINTLAFILFPITLVIRAVLDRKNAREYMKRFAPRKKVDVERGECFANNSEH